MSALKAPRYRRNVTHGIVHFGVGGFHRSHQAVFLHRFMLNGGDPSWGIVGVGTLETDRRLHEILTTQDGLYTVEARRPDGGSDLEVVGSLIRHLMLSDHRYEVLETLVDPATRIVTLTLTEGGYPQEPRPDGTFAVLTEALRRRREAGLDGFTIVSCDNIPHNGHITRSALLAQVAADAPEIADWVTAHVGFPDSMVDRITPATTPADVERVHQLTGDNDAWPVVCEPHLQWVLQDTFVASRPDLAAAGVELVEDVAPYERVKLRVLNGAHQSLAWIGLLLGHRQVREAIADPDVLTFVRRYLAVEVMPTLDGGPGIDVEAYVEQVLNRFAHPSIGDTLERIATDGSHRMPKFVLPVVRERLRSGLPVNNAAIIVACWWKAMVVASDEGFTVNDEPLACEAGSGRQTLDDFLADRSIFEGLDAFADHVRAKLAALADRPVREVIAEGN